MHSYIIPLYSGIGNIIQSIPFANEMKKRYGQVAGAMFYPDYLEAQTIVENVFDKILRISMDIKLRKFLIVGHFRNTKPGLLITTKNCLKNISPAILDTPIQWKDMMLFYGLNANRTGLASDGPISKNLRHILMIL
jgi:hypothetical protein